MVLEKLSCKQPQRQANSHTINFKKVDFIQLSYN